MGIKKVKGKMTQRQIIIGIKKVRDKKKQIQKIMRIKKNNPERRKNFRARHNCENPGPRWKPRYWACRTW